MYSYLINYCFALGDIVKSNIIFVSIFVLIFISLILFTLVKRQKFNTVIYLIVYFLSILSLLTYFVINQFTGGEGINDATVFMLQYGIEGAAFGEFIPAGLTSFALIVLSICLFILFKSKLKKTKKVCNIYPYFVIILSLVINPMFWDIYEQLCKEEVLFNNNSDLNDNDFDDYYKTPDLQDKLKDKKIVVIYLESLERTYLINGLYPGLLPGIENLERKSISFTNLDQVPRTGHTIAGMVASQLGVPLVASSNGNTMFGIDYFLPKAIGIGDVLSENGYHLCFYHGGELNFAGKGRFYQTHKFNEVIGYNSLKKYLPNEDYQSTWGLYDDTMLELAYKKYVSLSQKYKKFGLFLLTIDTHFNGHIPPKYKNMKYREGGIHTLNVLKIADYLVSNFVNKILESPYGKDTVVILLSDHLSMGNDVINVLKKNKRRNTCMIISADIKKGVKINTYGSMIDVASTIYNYLGGDGEIGLGRNLFDNTEKTQEERLFIKKSLGRWKHKFEELWNYPRVKEKIVIKPGEQHVFVDERKFLLPVLIVFNKQFKTKIMFNFDFDKKLTEINKIWNKNSDYFILIDKYKNIDKILKSPRVNDKYCILYGKGKKYYKLEDCQEVTVLTKNEIADYFEIE